MKIILKFIAFFLLFCVSLSAHAQISNITTTISGEPLREKRYKDIQGSPYLTEEWTMGNMIKKDGNSSDPVLLRYNLYEDKLEYKFENKPYILNDPNVKGFTFTLVDLDGVSKTFIFEKGFKNIPNYDENTFFQVLYDNKIKLLQKINSKPTDITTTYGTTTTITKFIRSDSFFFVNETNEVVPVKRTNGALLKVLANNEVEAYVKKNKLSVKNDKDLVVILDFASSKIVK